MTCARRLYTVRKRMSMLFQSGALFTDLNVFDNGCLSAARTYAFAACAAAYDGDDEAGSGGGYAGAAKLMPSELSGGMARRAAWREPLPRSRI